MSTSKHDTNKLNFREFVPPQNGRVLLCPECGEALVQADIENFSSCPYCNHHFEQDTELEDYLLEPIVRTWIHQQNAESAMTVESEGFFEDENLEQNKKKF